MGVGERGVNAGLKYMHMSKQRNVVVVVDRHGTVTNATNGRRMEECPYGERMQACVQSVNSNQGSEQVERYEGK